MMAIPVPSMMSAMEQAVVPANSSTWMPMGILQLVVTAMTSIL
jgi:hypothetical protein